MNMRPSKVLNRMRAGEIATCIKLNISSTRAVELAAMCGFDCVWVDMEHVPSGIDFIEQAVNAAKAHDCDLLTRAGHGNRYISIVRHSGDAAPEARLQLGAPAHVYDTMKHEYLGEFTELALEIPAYTVRNLALLPAKNVPMQGNIRWEGGKFQLRLFRKDGATSGVVRLEVWCNGQERCHYSGNHLLSDRLDLTIDPGLFPEAGSWLLRVTDLFDGKVVEHAQQLPEGAGK